MSQRILPCFLAAFLLCLLLSQMARGQGIGGGIVGQVKDQSGAYVPAALVEVTNTATGRVRTVSSDSEGRYEVREMPPGSYDLTVLKGGFNTARIPAVHLSVTQVAQIGDITLTVAPVGGETVEVKAVEIAMVELDSPTLSTSFNRKQIRELPILTRDINNLALLAPGVVSSRTFSFTSTLVPFAANGSRGRDANFIVDAVDNNEPLFGGAATQFTNTEIFAEYRILTSEYKAEFGRNSGSVVNIITERGGNAWHGSSFWFAQRDALNATNLAERVAGRRSPATLNENILGATLGGPIKRDSAWFFVSYQWDGARNDLSDLYPRVTTLPTVDGLNALSTMPQTSTLAAYLADPTVRLLPTASAPCVTFISGLPAVNPCTITNPSTPIMVNGRAVEFGSFLVPQAGLFALRDHQVSVRVDHRLTQKDDLSGRYLVDDLLTPLAVGAAPFEVGFFDIGLLPEASELFAQRSQNAGIFWTHAWPRTLHELRISYSRNASLFGDLRRSELDRETLPAVTVFDNFATSPAPGGTPSGTSQFSFAFPAEGQVFTLGSDTRPSRIRSNLYQVQDNLSVSRGRHSLKFGANFVRTLSAIRDIPSDLGDYFYTASSLQPSGFANFVANAPAFAFEHFGNFGGSGGESLPLRIFSQFYFAEDDVRVAPFFTLTLGLRYENFGEPINVLAALNPNFGSKLQRDNTDFGPRVGFALGLGTRMALRGGYGLYYNPAAFDIALIGLQGGRLSPFVGGIPTNVYPQPPFNPNDALRRVTDCDSLTVTTGPGPTFADCTAEDQTAKDLKQPRAQNFALSLERQFGENVLVQASYVGNVSTQLLERLNNNPRRGWQIQNPCPAPPCAVYLPRIKPNRGEITLVQNGARSSFHSLQASVTKRYTRPGFFQGLALTAAYTWSHMIDTASEIFDPDVRRARSFKSLRRNPNTVEVLTLFAQDPNNPHAGERGNSSFDRRHRASASFLWSPPSPTKGVERTLLGGWEFGGVFSAQTGQPFSPLNSFGACVDSAGDGILTNDRPSIGNASAPLDRIALVADPNCVSTAPSALSPTGYLDTEGNPIDPSTAHFVQVPLGHAPGTRFGVGSTMFIAGNAGRNILIGPSIVNFDFSAIKNLHPREGLTLQLRFEVYNLLNRPNAGVPIGNVFSANTQAVPALAFGTVLPSPFGGLAAPTPARISGMAPENSLDAFDSNTLGPLFLSRRFMNTSSRHIQAGLKILF